MNPLQSPCVRVLFLLVTISWCARPVHGAPDASGAPSGLRPAGLRCEYATNPLGIDEKSPRLSWIGESARRGERQSAYQIIVASSAELLQRGTADRWDSGKVLSDESAHVVYAGEPPGSRAACFWKVRVWDRDGNPSAWSEPAEWTMGLLAPEDWQARWIDATVPPAPGSQHAIVIRNAVYETPDHLKSVDVTALLARLVADGKRRIAVNSETLGGDPAPQKVKQLRVEYEDADQPRKATVREGNPLVFDVASEEMRGLRKEFEVKAPVTRATLYITALGLYECRLNGQRVGDNLLTPGWTDYRQRVRYQTYEVGPLLRAGGNALGVLTASGWYAGHLGNGGFQEYGTTPALLAQLEIVYANGRTERIVSDVTWQSLASPILQTDFMLGERYDARLETPGWDQPRFVATSPQPAHVRDEKPLRLDAQVGPPVRQLAERKPVSVKEVPVGRWIFDLGQNMVGVVRLKVHAPAGTAITLRHAEMLNADGTLYTANLRRAPSTDTYICKGGAEETWQPRFTFHGFRYVELSGLADKPSADAVTGIVIGSDTPRAGTFTCSNALLNQLVSNIEWGQRGNYLSVPTDCPQRDERLGWMGDAQVFVRTATNMADVAGFFTKWLVDVDDAQTPDGAFTNVSPQRGAGAGVPAWADAGVICPWTIYEAYGDRRILERHLPAMTRWVEWCRLHSTNLLRDKDRGHDYGDWLSQGENTPKEVIGTAYFAYSTHLVARSYHAVGDEANAAKYEQLFRDICAVFNQAYVAADGRVKGDTQCGSAMALKFGLLPEAVRPLAVQHLADNIAAHGNHLTTGFVGVSYLLPVLTAGGRLDTAYALLTQETFPSWLFSVKQGATTIWERWDGWTPEKGFQSPSMNSFNHYSLGSCGEWLYDTVAGIGLDPAQPGYQRMMIRPRPGGGLESAAATRQTMYGQVASRWTCRDGKFALEVTIPANTSARIVLPASDASQVLESGTAPTSANGVTEAVPVEGQAAFDIGSGTYHFACPLNIAPGQRSR